MSNITAFREGTGDAGLEGNLIHGFDARLTRPSSDFPATNMAGEKLLTERIL
ncbi:MAG TPA: hypothetical protein VF154_18570 [Terriglobales bacterium]